MKHAHPKREDLTLRPVGAAFAAVVAGLGASKAEAAIDARPHAPLEPAEQANTYFVDPTNHAGFEEDASFVVGRSEPVAPFAGKTQSDLFD